MQYKKIKNADLIVGSSKYLVKNPYEYQKRWHELFNNSNPICLELGMGRGDFIIDYECSILFADDSVQMCDAEYEAGI